MEELKNCKFCGEYPQKGMASSVWCKNKKCWLFNKVMGLDIWNTRTPSSSNGSEENHCKDCCCARAWEALGIKEYTGKSIAEHITELKEFKQTSGLENNQKLWEMFSRIYYACENKPISKELGDMLVNEICSMFISLSVPSEEKIRKTILIEFVLPYNKSDIDWLRRASSSIRNLLLNKEK